MYQYIGIFLSLLYLCGCGQFKYEDSNAGDLSAFSLTNCLYMRNSAGQIVSWKKATPISFYLTKSVPEKWKEVIKSAAKVWVNVSGTELIQISDEVSLSEETSNDKTNAIYWVDNGALLNYQQAQTATRWLKNQLQDADISINSKNFSFYDETPEKNRQVHLKSLMIHEFGHALGLKHVPLTSSVMFSDLAYLQIRIDLAVQDKTSLYCEY